MKCEVCLELLSGYIDRMLEPGELQQVEQHVRRCSACAAELRQLRETVTMLGALEEVPVPASFRAGLNERLLLVAAEAKASNVRELTPWKRFKWAMPAASVAAAAAVALGVWQMGGLTAAPKQPVTQGTVVATVKTPSKDTGTPTATTLPGGVTPNPSGGTSSGDNTPLAPTTTTPLNTTVGSSDTTKTTPPTKTGGDGVPNTNQESGPTSSGTNPHTTLVPNDTGVVTTSVPTTNPTPVTTYTRQTIEVSYRVANPDAINADFWLYLTRAHSVGVTPQGQPVEGGVQYVLNVEVDQVDNVLAELGARGQLQGQPAHGSKDVTANVLDAEQALRDAEARGNQQEIAMAKQNVRVETNLLKWTEMRVTLLTK